MNEDFKEERSVVRVSQTEFRQIGFSEATNNSTQGLHNCLYILQPEQARRNLWYNVFHSISHIMFSQIFWMKHC